MTIEEIDKTTLSRNAKVLLKIASRYKNHPCGCCGAVSDEVAFCGTSETAEAVEKEINESGIAKVSVREGKRYFATVDFLDAG